MFFQYPYTDMYALNLDWMIKAIKEVQEIIENLGHVVNTVNGEDGDVTISADMVNATGINSVATLGAGVIFENLTQEQLQALYNNGVRLVMSRNNLGVFDRAFFLTGSYGGSVTAFAYDPTGELSGVVSINGLSGALMLNGANLPISEEDSTTIKALIDHLDEYKLDSVFLAGNTLYKSYDSGTALQIISIDTQATADSENLIYSGAVVDAIAASKAVIDAKLNPEDATPGTFLQINPEGESIWGAPATDAQIGTAVTNWLNTNVPTGTTVVIDRSLTIQDAAADAKVTGDEITDLKSAVSTITDVVTSSNLLNPDKIEVGYINTNGTISESNDYRHSELIPVTSGDTLYFSYWLNPAYSGVARGMSARFLCAYDSNKSPVSANGAERIQSYTVPVGISYIVISWSYSAYGNYQKMISIGDSIPNQFEEYYEYQKIADDIKLPNYEQLLSNVASAALSNDAATLAINETLTIGNAARFVKKNVGVFFYGKFSGSFSGIKVGKGYLLYRGKWLDITSTTVTVKSDTAGTILDTKTHGLTITNYISVSMFMGDDGILHYALNTVSGSYSDTCDIGNEFNYAPFVIGAQEMTDCKISVSYSDIKCPIWVIGDSYCGYSLSRVMGNIRQLGFTNFMVDAIAGGVAYDNVTGNGDKSMIDDFLRLTAFALPKILIWACGMNGSEDVNIRIIGYISKFCIDNNIELILYKTPNVPSINHNQLNAFVESTGNRFIDAFNAVSADSSGTWYTGFLSDDNIHPSYLGAQALAQRWLSDVPELASQT